MQVVGREGLGEGLRALPVVDAQKGVVGKGETDAGESTPPGTVASVLSYRLRAMGRSW